LRVLLDACVAKAARDALVALGHDVSWAGEWAEDPGDEEILRRAQDQGRILVTLDKDFGELAVHQELPHVGIVRIVGFRAHLQGPILAEILSRDADTLGGGAILTAEPGRLRIRTTHDHHRCVGRRSRRTAATPYQRRTLNWHSDRDRPGHLS
jgi:predicted nuclease of predicted toxin-antitoxin system